MNAFRLVHKFLRICCRRSYIRGLRMGVAAAVEHEGALKGKACKTVVDVGANRGQFSIVARQVFPQARVIAFEPLAAPSFLFRRVFSEDERVLLHQTAIGVEGGTALMHVAEKDDSSSLLPFTEMQESVFHGTGQVGWDSVAIAPLSVFLSADDIIPPAFLKVDVQGYELEALKGCEGLFHRFSHVYVECSFVELYEGQAHASEVIAYLRDRGFRLVGIYNMTYDRTGRAIQGDFLFSGDEGFSSSAAA
jgi:FkbM family methyltransferase